MAIVDTGPLYASIDRSDANHTRSVATLRRADLQLVRPTTIIAETTYVVGRRLGSRIEAAFLRGLTQSHVEAPTSADFARIAELVDQYSNLPLGGTDASIVALAERLGADTIITLDRRHFGVIRPRHVERFQMLPE